MHKKIESELVSLAHKILQMKNKEDVLALKEKAREIYEKLSVLAFVDRFVESEPSASKVDVLKRISDLDQVDTSNNTISQPDKSIAQKEVKVEAVLDVEPEVLEKTDIAEEELVAEVEVENKLESLKENLFSEPVISNAELAEIEDLESLFSTRKEEKGIQRNTQNTLEKELEGTISLDVTTDLFENAVRVETPKKSLNDTLIDKNLQIGLNDRIAFVKHLFDGSQGDFNRVLSQLNSFKTEKEAINFVSEIVKSDYDWSGKEEYEERFAHLISRKFV